MKNLFFYTLCLLCFACKTSTNKNITKADEIVPTDTVQQNNDTLVNSEHYLILGPKGTELKVVKEAEQKNFPELDISIEYKGDVIMSKNIDYYDLEIYRKYKPQTTFDDYKVEVYNGKLANPDFSTDPDSKLFITRIKEECKKGVNFAGHYTFVIWGCGSPCQSGVVVDRKTGKIFPGYDATMGTDFRKDSKLIIKNFGAIDTTTNLIEVCSFCEVSHEVWSNNEFKILE